MTQQQADVDRGAIREAVRRFAQEEIAPGAAERDRTKAWPADQFARAAELGYLGVSVPEDLGGSGLGLAEATIVGEEIARACMSTASVVLQQFMVADSIRRSGDNEQQARLLPGLTDGTTIGANAITEPEAGSDAIGMRTRAVRCDGGWLLSGTKTFITSGPVCDLALVYAKAGDPAGRDIGLFAVDAHADGVTRGAPFDKMGWRASPTGEIALDEVFVADENVLAAPGRGLAALMKGLNSERVYLCCQSLGLARAAFAAARTYAMERRQFGQPIAEFQLVRAKLADMYTGIETCAAFLEHTTRRVVEGPSDGEPRLLSSAAKLMATELAMTVTSEAVQIHGGYGYTTEYAVERYMRDAKILEIGGGTNEIQRNLLGKALTAAR